MGFNIDISFIDPVYIGTNNLSEKRRMVEDIEHEIYTEFHIFMEE